MTDKHPALLLSVVIPCKNSAQVLGLQLEALRAQHFDEPWEVIVADNGSTDATVTVASAFRAVLNLRVVAAPEFPGRWYACNVGASEARGRHVLFLDADDEVAPGYLKAMSAALTQHRFVAAQIDTVALNPGSTKGLRAPFQRDGLLMVFQYLPFALGCSHGVDRALFFTHGGYRSDLPHAEDVDFCWRLHLAGHPVALASGATVRYRFRTGARGVFQQTRGYGRGQVALFVRYRHLGMPPRPLRRLLRQWVLVVIRAPQVFSANGRNRWLQQLGYIIGRLEGSLELRTWYL